MKTWILKVPLVYVCPRSPLSTLLAALLAFFCFRLLLSDVRQHLIQKFVVLLGQLRPILNSLVFPKVNDTNVVTVDDRVAADVEIVREDVVGIENIKRLGKKVFVIGKVL